jgi:hypothetical protein
MLSRITTSWDDGHPLDLRLAEMLAARNLRGTFYVPRQSQNRTMSDEQIQRLSENFEIGAHTLNHVFLDACQPQRAREEIRDSKKWIEDITGKACNMFCPPGGKFNARHLGMIREAGYSGIRTVELLSLDEPRRCDGLFILPTTIQAHPHRRLAYGRNIARRRAWDNLWRYLRSGATSDWAGLAELLINECIRRGGVFHLWGHSWEIESRNQWKSLEQVLDRLAELSTQMSVVTNGTLCEMPLAINRTGELSPFPRESAGVRGGASNCAVFSSAPHPNPLP